MITETQEWYKCEYCGNISLDYEEIKECENTDRLIQKDLDKLVDCCKRLNELGCTIELREFPYYTDNVYDKKVAARLRKDDLKFCFKDAIKLIGKGEE